MATKRYSYGDVVVMSREEILDGNDWLDAEEEAEDVSAAKDKTEAPNRRRR